VGERAWSGTGRRTALLVLVGGLLLPVLPGAYAPWPGGPLPLAAQGVVEGRVTVTPPPPRRSAHRYPGTAAPTGRVQPIPVLAWIEGVVPGAPPRPASLAPVMAQRDTAFHPAGLVVPMGTTVRFPNQDPFFHNVFSYSGAARFDLGRYPRGESKDVLLEEPGIVRIYCEVHETMRAVVVVTENPFHAVVGEGGSFRLEGVPAGRWTVVVWHADLGSVEREVEVRDGVVSRLSVELR